MLARLVVVLVTLVLLAAMGDMRPTGADGAPAASFTFEPAAPVDVDGGNEVLTGPSPGPPLAPAAQAADRPSPHPRDGRIHPQLLFRPPRSLGSC